MNRARMIMILGGALVAVPAIAWACGSGGGDSGSSSSSDSSSSDSSSDSYSSSDSSTTTPSCFETTDVVGYRECTDFGAWRARRAAIAIELAAVTSYVDLSGVEASGDITHSDGSTYTYRVVGEDLGGSGFVAARGLALRTLVHGRHLYGGLESSFSLLSTEERTFVMQSGDREAMLSPHVIGTTNAFAVVGARRFADQLVGSLAPHGISVGGELAAGVRMTSIEAESQKGACITTDTTLDVSPALEARARADLWLSPNVSLGVWGGSDLVTRAPSAGLVLSSHLRPFDGTR
jgi:hypothetical protein